jgi:hypothetical protein
LTSSWRVRAIDACASLPTGKIAARKSVTPVGEPLDLLADRALVAGDRDVGWTFGTLAVEHGAVGRQEAVHLKGPARDLTRRGDVLGHHHRQPGDHARARPPGARGGLVDARHGVRAQRLRTGHPGDRAVGLAAGERQHLGRERGEQDRRRRRAGHAERRLHAELVAAEVDLALAQQRREHRHVLAHVAERLRERQAEHPLDDQLVRQPDAQAEASAARGARRQRLLRHRRRVARVGRRDRGAELDPAGLAPAQRAGEDRVEAEDVGEPRRREAVCFRRLGLRDQVVDGRRVAADLADADSDAHARTSQNGGARSMAAGAASVATRRLVEASV